MDASLTKLWVLVSPTDNESAEFKVDSDPPIAQHGASIHLDHLAELWSLAAPPLRADVTFPSGGSSVVSGDVTNSGATAHSPMIALDIGTLSTRVTHWKDGNSPTAIPLGLQRNAIPTVITVKKNEYTFGDTAARE